MSSAPGTRGVAFGVAGQAPAWDARTPCLYLDASPSPLVRRTRPLVPPVAAQSNSASPTSLAANPLLHQAMVTVAADVSLPPMVSDSTRPQAPATRYEEHRAAVTAASSDAESAVSGPSVAGEPSERGVPLLPSIKESMPFLDGTQFNAKQTESTAFKPGSKTDPSSCIQRLQPTPPFMCEDARKDQKSPGASLPPLLPTSSTPSTTSSPNVCAQCAPNEDPANVDLRAAAVQKAREIAKEIATEAALPERVGGQDWGERRKQAKLKQTFGFTCSRSQRAAQLKLTTSKLVESLPAEAKAAFLAVLQR